MCVCVPYLSNSLYNALNSNFYSVYMINQKRVERQDRGSLRESIDGGRQKSFEEQCGRIVDKKNCHSDKSMCVCVSRASRMYLRQTAGEILSKTNKMEFVMSLAVLQHYFRKAKDMFLLYIEGYVRTCVCCLDAHQTYKRGTI